MVAAVFTFWCSKIVFFVQHFSHKFVLWVQFPTLHLSNCHKEFPHRQIIPILEIMQFCFRSVMIRDAYRTKNIYCIYSFHKEVITELYSIHIMCIYIYMGLSENRLLIHSLVIIFNLSKITIWGVYPVFIHSHIFVGCNHTTNIITIFYIFRYYIAL